MSENTDIKKPSALQRGIVERAIMGSLFLVAGVGHFVAPAGFIAIVPKFIPGAAFWVYATGVMELVLGAGLFTKWATRRFGLAAIAFLILVYPANIWMAIEGTQIPGVAPMPPWAAWARLPLQFVMMWLVYRGTKKNEAALAIAPRTAP